MAARRDTSSARPAAPRRRDPEGHRRAILQAAREALATHGYARATIRDVARRAGVTHGLVMRHFGSKEALMRAALPDPPGLIEVTAAGGDPATLPDRIAHSFVTWMEDDTELHPLIGIVRTAGGDERAAGELYAEMRERTEAALAALVDADDLPVRAGFVAALLVGLTFERYILRTGALAAIDATQLERHLADAVRHFLGPVLPSGVAPPGD